MAKKFTVVVPPESVATLLGQAVDELWTAREARLKAQHAVDRLEEGEKELRSKVEALLREAKLDGAKGKLANAHFRRLQVPQLVDEEKFLKWAQKPDNRDCLKVGVNNEAWRARLGEGDKVPGVDSFIKETLAIIPA